MLHARPSFCPASSIVPTKPDESAGPSNGVSSQGLVDETGQSVHMPSNLLCRLRPPLASWRTCKLSLHSLRRRNGEKTQLPSPRNGKDMHICQSTRIDAILASLEG
ncbi:unnamed protein product [Protopolystoma xenopodis]|uniref:Uncharacterized protein n=1 Tax=Protopolystoma xenopodis TaxID=117903 RepID=A0A3S5AL59_9PLAT|nr:unnamed protein product [Protopolystoma xenopodis]